MLSRICADVLKQKSVAMLLSFLIISLVCAFFLHLSLCLSHCYIILYFLLPFFLKKSSGCAPRACGISFPGPGIEPVAPALEAQSLNHQTTGEVPLCLFV